MAILLNLMHLISEAVKSVQFEYFLLYRGFMELRRLGRQ